MGPEVYKKVLRFFEENGDLVTFGKGVSVVSPDEPSRGVYLITSGLVRMHAYSARGEDVTLNVFRPKTVFPMSLVFLKKKDRYTYTAVGPVKAYRVSSEKFTSFLSSERDVMFDLLRRIYLGLDGFMKRFEVLMTGGAREKLLVNLYINGLRFGSQSGTEIELQVSHQQLASETGLSRETVTRELSKLLRKGLIKHQKRKIIIVNIKAIEEMIESS